MSGIVTLTMNPAIDVSTSTARVEPGAKLRCAPEQRDPGGGGINVARVAHRLGGEVTALYPVGGLPGQWLVQLVAQEGLKSITIPVHGETREDFTVLDEASGEQFRFVLPGPRVRDVEWMACLKALAAVEARPAFICASGSLPSGAPADFHASVAEIARGLGAKLALDAPGEALKRAIGCHAYLVKPNLRELRDLSGQALADIPAMIAACRDLIAARLSEVVALTLGNEGALLVTADRAWRADPLRVAPASTIGAGDSFLGAMLWALAAGKPLEEAFRYGVAGGSAAVLATGTDLCRAQDVRRLLGDVAVTDLSGAPRAA